MDTTTPRRPLPRRRRSFSAATVSLAVVATLALAPTATATFPDRNGRIAFQAVTDSGLQIFTVRANGHDLRQVTHVDGDALNPDWSPDGRRIAFALNECSIALIDADGADLTVIPSAPDVCEADPTFTPDGSRLVFERYDPAIDDDAVWSMKLDGTDRLRITGAGAPDPNVSPDGARISFKGAAGALFMVNMDGTGLTQVSPTLNVAYKHDWAPDGRRIVFSDNASNVEGPVNIATIRPDGTDLRYLTHYPDRTSLAHVGGYSPDGQWIVFRLTHDGRYALYRMRPDGSDRHAILPFSSLQPRFIDWGPAADR